jgi:hypothetical protein
VHEAVSVGLDRELDYPADRPKDQHEETEAVILLEYFRTHGPEIIAQHAARGLQPYEQ